MVRIRPRHAAELLQVLSPLRHSSMCGAEVGVLQGATSRVLLKHLPELRLYMVDLWSIFAEDSEYYCSGDSAAREEQMASYLHEAEATTVFAKRRRLMMRMDSLTAATHVADGSLDFVFIDANHICEAVKADIHAWWPKIRSGGILSGHDYGCRRDRRGIWGVSRAANEFTERRELEVHTGPGHVWWCKKPTGSERTAPSTKADGTLVRVLFGDLNAYPKLRKEVIASLRHEWCRADVLHVVAGKENAELLKSHGAARVLQISNDNYIDLQRYGIKYTKPYLIRRSMDENHEILFLDFDSCGDKQPDCVMWELLRAKRGRFNGAFQAPNVGYYNPVSLTIHRDPVVHPVRRCLCTCAVYCTDRTWIDRWLDTYDDIARRLSPAAIRRDETALLHMLDGTYGVMDSGAMVEHFEIPIVRLRKGIPEAQKTKDERQIYFTHR